MFVSITWQGIKQPGRWCSARIVGWWVASTVGVEWSGVGRAVDNALSLEHGQMGAVTPDTHIMWHLCSVDLSVAGQMRPNSQRCACNSVSV